MLIEVTEQDLLIQGKLDFSVLRVRMMVVFALVCRVHVSLRWPERVLRLSKSAARLDSSGFHDGFRLYSRYSFKRSRAFPQNWRDFVIRCKGCGNNIPAPFETLPASWIAVKCPLCGEHRRYLPTDVFQGRVSYQLLGKPVRSAQGGAR